MGRNRNQRDVWNTYLGNARIRKAERVDLALSMLGAGLVLVAVLAVIAMGT